MYTIKGLLAEDGSASVLASREDWDKARQKAAEFRKQGLEVEIWHSDGTKVLESEMDSDLGGLLRKRR